MLAKRIIACLDVRDGCVVKGVQFEDLANAGDPAALARRYNVEGIDELVILDVTATLERRRALDATLRAVSAELFIPLAVGGGIKSEDDASAALDAGADKVALNSAALADPSLLSRLARRYGSQAVIVAIDAKRERDGYAVFARSGSMRTPREAVEWAREAADRGAGEVLLTSIDRDGTRTGFDCALTAAVSSAVPIPVIASGGAGTFDHFFEVFTEGRADAALAASVFHFREHAVGELKAYLCERGVPVRLLPPTSNLQRPTSAVLIPSIDLQGGRIVQLVQGERLALATDDFDGWVERFRTFPKVQLIDLDAAKNVGDNRALVESLCAQLPCRVGGGVRSVSRAEDLLAIGAKKVIVGSAIFKGGQPDVDLAASFFRAIGENRWIAAVDARGGRVVVDGWRTQLAITPEEAMRCLEPYTAEFLFTNVDIEGLMRGVDRTAIERVRAATTRRLTAAGGVTTLEEVDWLHSIGVDAVVGMAIYTGRMNPPSIPPV